MYKTIIRATEMTQGFIKGVIEEDSIVIDATLGTGRDTAFLAQLVPRGRVYSFDIQQTAITNYKKKYGENENVTLILDGHENILNYVKEPPKVIMFNLGYLPCGDKSIVTKPETTLKALEAGLKILAPNGIISIVSYIGHSGGSDEANAIIDFTNALNPREYAVMEIRFSNTDSAPFIIFIEKNHNSDAHK